jgi:drug/metabolite transporter (DMT)-like permease
MLAAYTAIDAYGIRQAENPFTFLAWFFALGMVGFPFIALARWRRMAVKPPLRPLVLRGFIGAVVALMSFSSVMVATRIDSVGQTAALRETSIVFATAIGVLVFRERIDMTRLALIACIAAGAVLVEVG